MADDSGLPGNGASENSPLLRRNSRMKTSYETLPHMPRLNEDEHEDEEEEEICQEKTENEQLLPGSDHRHRRKPTTKVGVQDIPIEIVYDKTCWQKFRTAVTMEPVMFLYYFANSALITTVTQYVYARLASEGNLTDAEPASNDTCGYNEDANDSQAQSDAAEFLVIFNFILAGPGIFLSLFLGSYSDHHGRRLSLILAFSGVFMRSAFSMAVAMFELDLNFLLLAAALEGLLGGQCSIKSSVYAYIADISQKDDRNLRMFIVQMMSTIGNASAQISIGYLIAYTGFVYPFLFVTIVAFSIIPIILFYIRESVDTSKTTGKDHSVCKEISETLSLFYKDDGTERLWKLRILICIIAMIYFAVEASMDMTFLYALGYPVCFDSVLAGYMNAFYYLGSCFVPLALLSIFRLHFSDFVFIITALVFSVVSKLWYNIPMDPIPLMFTAAAINFLSTMSNPLLRAAMSKNTDAKEQGALSSCITMVTTSTYLLGCMINNSIYSATYDIYREIAFDVDAAVLLVALGLSIYIKWAIQREEEERDRLATEEMLRERRFSRRPSYYAERRYSADISVLSPHT